MIKASWLLVIGFVFISTIRYEGGKTVTYFFVADSIKTAIHPINDTSGIIDGYRAVVNPKMVGWELRVLIDLTTTPQQYSAVIPFMEGCSAIQSAHHVTGGASFRIEAFVPSIMALEDLVGQLSVYGQTKTSIVLSSPVQKTVVSSPLHEVT